MDSKTFLFSQDCFIWHFLVMRLSNWWWNLKLSLNPEWLIKKWVYNINWENSLPSQKFISFLPSFPACFLLFVITEGLFQLVFSTKSQAAKFGKRDQWLEVYNCHLMALPLFLAIGKAGTAEVFWHLKGFLVWDTPPSCGWLFRAIRESAWLSPKRSCPMFIAFLTLHRVHIP